MYCSNCGEEIDDVAFCPHCGVSTTKATVETTLIKTRSPGVAAIMSFFIPGLGQIYNGEILGGLGAMLIIIILMVSIVELGVWGLLLLVGFWVYCIYDAYQGPSVKVPAREQDKEVD